MDKKTGVEIKLFSDFSDLDKENKQTFYEFSEFNSFLEKKPTSYINLYNSYIKVVLDIGRKDIDFNTYSELDFQIKLLIENTKVPINKILDFANLKFGNFEAELHKIIKGFHFLEEDEISKILKVLLKNKQGILTFSFLDDDLDEVESISIIFDINNFDIENIKKLKTQIENIDYSFISEKGVISKRFEITS